ncbi:MAG TPA: MBL fold metallo-hydrolase [bacterium]|nr:MBL fold metallo-hydrolase [bacterium]
MNTLQIKTIVVGYLDTNCYVLNAAGRNRAVIIDPGGNSSRIIGYLEEQELELEKVLLTHGHNDHIGALHGLLHRWNVPVLLHEKEAEFLNIPRTERTPYAREEQKQGFNVLRDGDIVDFEENEIKVLYTPGHTPGGVCFLFNGFCFTGDTLFNDGVGRTDFEGGDRISIITSIKEKLLSLDDEIEILPGHGPASTIGCERRYFD